MPFLQFLNGSRVDEFEELNPAASLVVGSADDEGVHIRLTDPGIEARHCQVYPGNDAFWLQDLGAGRTILHMKALKAGVAGLAPNDVFILGTTFVRFVLARPAGAGGAAASPAAGGASAAELQQARAEVARLTAELAQARERAGLVDGLEAEAARLRDAQARSEQETGAARERAASLEAELAEARARVAALEGEVGGAREAAEEARTAAEREVAAAKADAERAAEEARAEAARAAEEARTEAAREAEAARAEAQRAAAEAEASVGATRAALEALRAREEARGDDRLEALRRASDLAKLLDALALPEPVRARLEAAIEQAVDREALRRVAGPVVPLRGLRVPGLDRDLEGELRAAREHLRLVDEARALGLHELPSEDLERVLALAGG